METLAYFEDLLPALQDIARQAGRAILPYHQQLQADDVTFKSDDTPVTKADRAAHDIIVSELAELTPAMPVLSEEGNIPDYSIRSTWDKYWLVDPLDGTRGFVAGNKQFTVNIAGVVDHKAVVAVLYVPCDDIMYYACKGFGAYKQQAVVNDPLNETIHKLHTKPIDFDHLRIVTGVYNRKQKLKSRLHELKYTEWLELNSSWKFAAIAEGGADIYPRMGETYEWDTAAGQCILNESGGILVNWSGQEISYNNKESLLNGPFIALGDRKQLDALLRFIDEL